MKKLTFEYVKNYIENFNYKLDSKEYINAKQKLELVCPFDHNFAMTWDAFKSGQRCPKCAGNKKFTYKEVKDYFENEGYKLISTEYKNNSTKLISICPLGHIHDATFADFRHGYRCNKCGIKKSVEKRKIPYETIKNIFNEHNCELLTSKDEYKGVLDLVKFKCSCGNIDFKTPSSFKNGFIVCSICSNKKRSESHRFDFEYVKQLFVDNGCELLSSEDEYINNTSNLIYKCSCGNVSNIILKTFLLGTRCNKCLQQRKEVAYMAKFGVSCPMKRPEIKNKVRNTLYKNNNAPTSKQQLYLYNLIGGELNYPHFGSSLDIAFPENNIYIEYDGGLHDGKVKFKQMTKDEFDKFERKRWYSLYRDNWKEIRIISKNDYLPYDDKIKEIIKYAKDYINTGHSWIKFDIDKGIVYCSQFNKEYDFGELRKITKIDMSLVV